MITDAQNTMDSLLVGFSPSAVLEAGDSLLRGSSKIPGSNAGCLGGSFSIAALFSASAKTQFCTKTPHFDRG